MNFSENFAMSFVLPIKTKTSSGLNDSSEDGATIKSSSLLIPRTIILYLLLKSSSLKFLPTNSFGTFASSRLYSGDISIKSIKDVEVNCIARVSPLSFSG